MASFYSATGNLNNNNNDGSGGASGGDDGGNTGNNQGFLQPQQQSQQQPGFSQWQPKPEGHGQDQGQPYGQQQQQQQQTQQQSTPQPFWSPNNAQQMATQAAAGFVAQAATGNFTSEKVLTQGYDQIQKAFGGGIPGMDYIMRSLRSYFAVDNRYVKRKIVIILFPFRNKHWSRNVNKMICVTFFNALVFNLWKLRYYNVLTVFRSGQLFLFDLFSLIFLTFPLSFFFLHHIYLPLNSPLF
mmetsp:Transcript_6482/g.6962  ORF Transcript_6482/g.6962 Transcript_6482/m.6962 type:complete len:241 (+) Transcript_6482:65-787(+)